MKRFEGLIANDDDYADAIILVDEYRRRTHPEKRMPEFHKQEIERVLYLSDKEALLLNTMYAMMVASAIEGSPLLAASLGQNLVAIIANFTSEEQINLNNKMSEIVRELPDEVLGEYGKFRMRNMSEGIKTYNKIDKMTKDGPKGDPRAN